MTPDERIEDALRQIGRDVTPPTGWEDRVYRRTVDQPSRAASVAVLVAVGLTVLVAAVVVALLAVSP